MIPFGLICCASKEWYLDVLKSDNIQPLVIKKDTKYCTVMCFDTHLIWHTFNFLSTLKLTLIFSSKFYCLYEYMLTLFAATSSGQMQNYWFQGKVVSLFVWVPYFSAIFLIALFFRQKMTLFIYFIAFHLYKILLLCWFLNQRRNSAGCHKLAFFCGDRYWQPVVNSESSLLTASYIFIYTCILTYISLFSVYNSKIIKLFPYMFY